MRMLPDVPLRPSGEVIRTAGVVLVDAAVVAVAAVGLLDTGEKPACMTTAARIRQDTIQRSGVHD